MTDQTNEQSNRPAPKRSMPRRLITGGAVVLALAVAAVGGAEGTRLAQRWHPQPVMLLNPVAVNAMKPDTAVAIKGKVAEVFGNKFILQDGSGRALIDTGPAGEGRKVVDTGEDITVQGRFDRGIVHAQLAMHANGQTDSFGPPPRGPHPHGPQPQGPKDPGAAPPPPPPAQ